MKTTSFESLRKRLLKNKEFKKAYDELEPEFALIRMIIRKRLNNGLTQKQLAAKLGTKQPVISRLESGTYNPSIKFLHRVADALGAEIHISIS
ncbi:MAG: transcriptional regulator [Candidatus Doudnabacteria bacterium RIFCSPHIGHO2_01_FULL_46_14]|uniref:Transcriptional regulator n=1 Tax=Candidatus Doudnabacteria bacterium RIFCSPHIGHO2_01_FULL_46_14 TaxID=1817824 RepID=A0A1F5NJH8_9BACT|nr:MAG: transcriptional regulator [Candidatus Doudnabacteria bacterium RIFCSPHIGHO2_01_FULL_46_14]